MITALAPDFSLFTRRPLVTLRSSKPEKIIDPARLALTLREKFYARTPPKLRDCDRWNERQAVEFVGAINTASPAGTASARARSASAAKRPSPTRRRASLHRAPVMRDAAFCTSEDDCEVCGTCICDIP